MCREWCQHALSPREWGMALLTLRRALAVLYRRAERLQKNQRSGFPGHGKGKGVRELCIPGLE